MSTDLQTPSHREPPRGPRLAGPHIVAGTAAVLVAAATTGVLIATAADRPAQEPAIAAASPSASRSVPAPAPVTAPAVTAPDVTAPLAGGPPATMPVIASPVIASPVIASPVIASPVIASPVIAPPVTAPPTAATDTGSVPVPADDVDGDGRRDVVSLPATGRLRIRYATGLTDTVAFDAMAGESRLLGIADADDDGRGEVFVRVGAGAYTDQASVFRYVDGRLRLVTLDGRQVQLVSGASVRHSTSWACRPPRTPIVMWSGESDDGATYHGTLDSYRFTGATLTQVSSRPLTTDDLRPPPVHCGQIRT